MAAAVLNNTRVQSELLSPEPAFQMEAAMIGGDDDGLGHRGSKANATRIILPDVAVACHRATIHRVIAFHVPKHLLPSIGPPRPITTIGAPAQAHFFVLRRAILHSPR